MNVFNFTGNLGRDARTGNANGHAVMNFAVGVKSGYGDNEQTLWIDCAAWGKQAEGNLIQYMTKGQRVSVSGELGQREYQANDGAMKTALTCRVNSVGLEGGANGQQAAQQRQQPAQQQQPQRQQPHQPQGGFDDFDDVPF